MLVVVSYMQLHIGSCKEMQRFNKYSYYPVKPCIKEFCRMIYLIYITNHSTDNYLSVLGQ